MQKYLFLLFIFVSVNCFPNGDEYLEKISPSVIKIINEKFPDITKSIHGPIPEDAFLNIVSILFYLFYKIFRLKLINNEIYFFPF